MEFGLSSPVLQDAYMCFRFASSPPRIHVAISSRCVRLPLFRSFCLLKRLLGFCRRCLWRAANPCISLSCTCPLVTVHSFQSVALRVVNALLFEMVFAHCDFCRPRSWFSILVFPGRRWTHFSGAHMRPVCAAVLCIAGLPGVRAALYRPHSIWVAWNSMLAGGFSPGLGSSARRQFAASFPAPSRSLSHVAVGFQTFPFRSKSVCFHVLPVGCHCTCAAFWVHVSGLAIFPSAFRGSYTCVAAYRCLPQHSHRFVGHN